VVNRDVGRIGFHRAPLSGCHSERSEESLFSAGVEEKTREILRAKTALRMTRFGFDQRDDMVWSWLKDDTGLDFSSDERCARGNAGAEEKLKQGSRTPKKGTR
jgi:hypothetical protein